MTPAAHEDQRATAVFSGSSDGYWKLSLLNPQAIAASVGRQILAAFFKCFVATDRVTTLEQMLELNALHVAVDTPAYDRNLRILVLLMASTLYELGQALQELCEARVVEKMSDKSPWDSVNEARKRWHTDPLMGKLRNQLGHHLGKLDNYCRGVDSMVNSNDDILLAHGGQTRHSEEYPAAWNAIFLGIDIDAKAFADGVRLTRKTHEDLPDALVAVFAEVLEGCGVHVEDRRLSTP
jgi:hypothetical protein